MPFSSVFVVVLNKDLLPTVVNASAASPNFSDFSSNVANLEAESVVLAVVSKSLLSFVLSVAEVFVLSDVLSKD